MSRWIMALAGMLLLLPACADTGGPLEVDLTTSVVPSVEAEGELRPRVESGFHEITVREVFTARGPCRELEALLTRDYSEGFLLRIEAREAEGPCLEESPHLLYTAVLRGLPEGSHPLRVVHVGADGRTLNETVLAHPVLVTAPPR
jgi:hypothetical protein